MDREIVVLPKDLRRAIDSKGFVQLLFDPDDPGWDKYYLVDGSEMSSMRLMISGKIISTRWFSRLRREAAEKPQRIPEMKKAIPEMKPESSEEGKTETKTAKRRRRRKEKLAELQSIMAEPSVPKLMSLADRFHEEPPRSLVPKKEPAHDRIILKGNYTSTAWARIR